KLSPAMTGRRDARRAGGSACPCCLAGRQRTKGVKMHGSLDPRASVGDVVRRGAALALGLFASMGWIPGTVAEAGAQQAGVVTGVVVSAERREPLADVRVVIEGTDLGALTDVRGRYRIAGVPAGSRVVVASAMGRGTGRRRGAGRAGGRGPGGSARPGAGRPR